MSQSTSQDPRYSIAYGHVEGDENDDPGELASGAGLLSWAYHKKSDGSDPGRFALRFVERSNGGGFQSLPAIVVTPTGEAQQHVRLNAIGSSENADRRVAARVDGYGWSASQPAPANDPKNADTSFQVIAVASAGSVSGETFGSNDPENCALRRGETNGSVLANERSVRIVGGVVDMATRSASPAYGCAVDTSGAPVTGRVKVTFASPGFTDVPAVAATLESDDKKLIATVRVASVTRDGVEILLGDGPRLFDGKIHLLAVGPGTPLPAVRLAYGVVDRNSKKRSGVGFELRDYEDTAIYRMKFDPHFTQTPVIVASAEHVNEGHLRQLNVRYSKSDPTLKERFRLMVVGREVKKKALGPNDSRFHFIAFAPENGATG